MSKSKLNKAIDQLIQRLEKTEKFVLDQAPDICKEMVKEKMFDYKMDLAFQVTSFVASALVLIACGVLAYSHVGQTDWMFGCGLFGTISLLLVMLTTDTIILTIKRIYYVTNCTKLFLLNEFKDLIS